jgi:hypothetical protein
VLERLDHLLGGVGILPEVDLAHAGLCRGDLLLQLGEVKDNLVADP